MPSTPTRATGPNPASQPSSAGARQRWRKLSYFEQPAGTARVSLRAVAGHITPGRCASLVDAVLDLPRVWESAPTLPAVRALYRDLGFNVNHSKLPGLIQAAGHDLAGDRRQPGVRPASPGPGRTR